MLLLHLLQNKIDVTTDICQYLTYVRSDSYNSDYWSVNTEFDEI